MRIGADSTVTAGWKPAWDAAVNSPDRGLDPDVNLDAADDGTLVAAFVVRHRRAIYQLCYRFVGNHEDASDLAQDVFVRAFKGLRHFKGQSAVGTWLYRVGVNTCLNRVATKRPRTEALDAAAHVDGAAP